MCPGTAEASRHLLLGCNALTLSQVSVKLLPMPGLFSYHPPKPPKRPSRDWSSLVGRLSLKEGVKFFENLYVERTWGK